MNIRNSIIVALFALAAFFPLVFSSGSVLAQQNAAPVINGFDVEPAQHLVAGSELVFTLYGTPGGTARVRIGGATGSLLLDQVEAGVYEGTYTIRQRDRITASSTATANLRVGNQVATSVLDESLLVVANGGRRNSPAAQVLTIDRFNVDPPNRLVTGADLYFTLSGSPGGVADIRIAGVKGKFALDEVKPGVYEGAYTIKDRDRIAADAAVTATLRRDNHETSAVLGQSLIAGSVARASPRRAAAVCPNCGVIEAVNVIEVKGDGSYIGMIAGGLGGLLVGSQIGQGRGNTAAEIAGAAGGAYAGNEIEKRMKTAKHYEVVVRLENGTAQTISYAAAPGLKAGDRVKIENGTLVRN
jgi:outer membrane lipoprotein SlyB